MAFDPDAPSRYTSIKTRIETPVPVARVRQYRRPLATLPSKQGLKLDAIALLGEFLDPLATLPSKQGLKPHAVSKVEAYRPELSLHFHQNKD